MARDNDKLADGHGRGPHYSVVWYDFDWLQVDRVDHCTAGEVVTHAVNFINFRRKVAADPSLQGQHKLGQAIGLVVEEVQRG